MHISAVMRHLIEQAHEFRILCNLMLQIFETGAHDFLEVIT